MSKIINIARPFMEAIGPDQSPSVLKTLAETISKNLPSDQKEEHIEEFRALGINIDAETIAFDTNCAVDAVVTNAPLDNTNFTADPELLSLYSKIVSEHEMSEKRNANKIARTIINSGNPSLLFVALKSPFAEEYVYKFAKKLAEIGGIKYLYSAFSAIPKKTNASRLMARVIVEAGDVSVIYEAVTNFDVEDGTKESIILAHGLAMTKAYELMEKAYANYDEDIKESLILCNSMASSGDVDFIQRIIGNSSGKEELKILACGLQAASVYTQIKKALL